MSVDFFAILVLITVIINAVSAIRKKAKDYQQAPPVRVVRRAAAPQGGEIREQRMTGEQWPQPLPQPERHGYEGGLQRRTAEDLAHTPIAADIVRMLSKKDGLVAAFVLHEILDRPRALRRR